MKNYNKLVYLNMSIRLFLFIALYNLGVKQVKAQNRPISSGEIQLGLQKLGTLGTVLYFAAHPDDENTRLIAWLALEKKYRTAYLSLTRGDGGQNLIGTEQGIELGLIRTQELLAARAMDHGEQYFTSAYDFGFSKTHEETFSFWDKETALREAVWLIRKLRPDIIINRFPPDKRGGHGHHQASAILAHEAFLAAGNSNMFPDQLDELEPWQAKRVFWNTANFGGMNNTSEDQLKIDIGAYSPLKGRSYGEIAAESRSQHKSQGFGAASSRGTNIEYFDLVAGDEAHNDLMEGVVTSWNRVPNSFNIQQTIARLNDSFDPNKPEKSIADLFELRSLIQKIEDTYWKEQKTEEIEKLIVACAGLAVEATTTKPQYAIHTEFDTQLEAVVQNPEVDVLLHKVDNKQIDDKLTQNKTWKGNKKLSFQEITQPYWLVKPATLGKFDVDQKNIGFPENKDKPSVVFNFKINGQDLQIETAVKYKYVDPVQGERYQDIAITPAITASLSTSNLICTNSNAQSIRATFTRQDTSIKTFHIELNNADGWKMSPSSLELVFGKENSITKELEIAPTYAGSPNGQLGFTWKGAPVLGISNINYEHIPSITWFPKTETKLLNLQIENPIKNVAYLPGAGDLVAQSLEQIGVESTLLNEEQIKPDLLKNFDAVLVGVRYFNVGKKTNETIDNLLKYVHDGGTVLIQYNVNTGLSTNKLGPFPFQITRDRVTEEDAKVVFDKNDSAFRYPNKISEEDFEGWVQERGLYFASNIDARYRTPLLMNDKGEQNLPGSLLISEYGKGKFVYTSLSFFRQLPAGVPGAYRLFVNLLSREK